MFCIVCLIVLFTFYVKKSKNPKKRNPMRFQRSPFKKPFSHTHKLTLGLPYNEPIYLLFQGLGSFKTFASFGRLGRARDGKTRQSKINKTDFPLFFWENYVDSDFSIAPWRYVGMKSTTLSSPKSNKIKFFSHLPNQTIKAKKAKHSHKHKQKGSCGVPQM